MKSSKTKRALKRTLALFVNICLLLQFVISGNIFNLQAAAQESTSEITFSYLANGTWKGFNGITESSMDGIKIQTPSDSPYYLQYRTWNQGNSSYYPYVKSNINDYAGSSGKPIQRLQIQAYKNDGTKLTTGVVVMYRAKVENEWYPGSVTPI